MRARSGALDELRTLLATGGRRAPGPRRAVAGAGPDAGSYLQGQLSQDVAGLAPGAVGVGAGARSPRARSRPWCGCTRTGADDLRARHRRRVGAGPGGPAPPFPVADQGRARAARLAGRGRAGRRLRRRWSEAGPCRRGRALDAVQWAGSGRGGPARRRPAGPRRGYRWSSPRPWRSPASRRGFPAHGGRARPSAPSRPRPGLVERSVSFTKGCYTGQELVARIDSRGSNVPRHLRGLRLSGPAAPGERLYRPSPPGEGGAEEAKEVGRLTSVARSPQRGWVALGYVGRAVTVGESLVVAGGAGPGRPQGPVRRRLRSACSRFQATGVEPGPGPPPGRSRPAHDAVGPGQSVRRPGHVLLRGPRASGRHDRDGVAGGAAGLPCSARGPGHRAARGHPRGHRQFVGGRPAAGTARHPADDHAGRHHRLPRRRGDHPVTSLVGVRNVGYGHRRGRRVLGQFRQYRRRPGQPQPVAQHAPRFLRRGVDDRPAGNNGRPPGRVLAARLRGAPGRRAGHGGGVVVGGPPCGAGPAQTGPAQAGPAQAGRGGGSGGRRRGRQHPAGRALSCPGPG